MADSGEQRPNERFEWGTAKQWLGWIVFAGAIPSVAALMLARRMLHSELTFYLAVTPPLLLYFYALGRLGLDVPGTAREVRPEDIAYGILTFSLTAGSRAGKVILWLRTIVIHFVMPPLGAGLIYYGVRDGEIAGYILGPMMIWVSGGLWAMTVQFLMRRGRGASEEG